MEKNKSEFIIHKRDDKIYVIDVCNLINYGYIYINIRRLEEFKDQGQGSKPIAIESLQQKRTSRNEVLKAKFK